MELVFSKHCFDFMNMWADWLSVELWHCIVCPLCIWQEVLYYPDGSFVFFENKRFNLRNRSLLKIHICYIWNVIILFIKWSSGLQCLSYQLKLRFPSCLTHPFAVIKCTVTRCFLGLIAWYFHEWIMNRLRSRRIQWWYLIQIYLCRVSQFCLVVKQFTSV